MLRSIDVSRAGMLRQQQALDAGAHNIANANTPGFKAIRAALESGDVPSTDPAEVTGTDTPGLQARLNIGRLFTPGPVRATGALTDMAIDGDGFFSVRRPDGATAYTRNGSFSPDAGGRLVDPTGNLLQPGITLPNGATALRIGGDGLVSATLPGGRTEVAGRIALARFTNPHGLTSTADGLYTATAASGAALVSAPGQNGAGDVRTGALEGANTDIADQMTSVMAAQRAFQLNTSAFRMADDMLRLAGGIGSNS